MSTDEGQLAKWRDDLDTLLVEDKYIWKALGVLLALQYITY